MNARSNAAPVIIKRKKIIAGGGHHGGAWKVAYADFVTAMMAFFLLMWLLNATTEQQRKGIADYFTPTIPVNRISGGGNGAFGGDSVFSEDVLAQNGMGASRRFATEARQARGDVGLSDSGHPSAGARADAEAFAAVEALLADQQERGMGPDDPIRHMVLRQTDEGLVIELFDLPGAQLFEPGGLRVTAVLEQLIPVLSSAVSLVTNDIAIAGFTRAQPITLAKNPVWDLSSARANRLRQALEQAGVAGTRMQRVTGHADRAPVTRDPMALRNNRLEVILLRSELR